jgi:hypothetical protein
MARGPFVSELGLFEKLRQLGDVAGNAPLPPLSQPCCTVKSPGRLRVNLFLLLLHGCRLHQL